MKEIIPTYYQNFRCKAGECRHSCCIGWEIDIDDETMLLYDDPATPLYARFRTHIERTDPPHFCLDEKERCPFLNAQGLCDIIMTMGEESLCQICDDHPRFRNYFSDRTETGLGLCCEAVAELILFQMEPAGWLVQESAEACDTLTEEETELLAVREEIYHLLKERSVPLQDRLFSVLELCGSALPEKTGAEWCEVFRNLERLDPAWDAMLHLPAEDNASLSCDIRQEWQVPLENLAVYFVFRHIAGALEDRRIAARAAFCVLGVFFIHRLWQKQAELTPEAMAETVRLYSSEIEYSEDNTDALLTLLDP
ncbi:MAG: flagellin lysine-N-methylase [Clostridia bacterium]|nr:flagellin lysine-N-methylase [Clostridia bacterium]